ncbi:hypothetical protein BRL93_20550 [Xanthomonas oryzae pv. oryzae]|nr:hypothetical protein BRL93_20550 [Xanthomonas oryzae pv. oryzae]
MLSPIRWLYAAMSKEETMNAMTTCQVLTALFAPLKCSLGIMSYGVLVIEWSRKVGTLAGCVRRC